MPDKAASQKRIRSNFWRNRGYQDPKVPFCAARQFRGYEPGHPGVKPSLPSTNLNVAHPSVFPV